MRLLTSAIDRILKRDRFGNYPKWWQWFFPRYGNWGGPGWSAGRWNPPVTDWAKSAVCVMDEFFKTHDFAYQHGCDRDVADHNLIQNLKQVTVKGGKATLYRIGAIACFSVWPKIRWN